MKNFLAFLFLLAFALGVDAQTSKIPQTVNFQAVARDAAGLVKANLPLQVKLTVREGSATGNPVYCADYNTSTNAFGAFSIQLNRNATPCAGSAVFEAINWESGSKWIQVEYRFDLGAYTDLGATEIASSFYAFAARSAEKVAFINTDNAEEGFVLAYDAAAKIWKPRQLVLNGIGVVNGGPGISAVQNGNTVTVTNTGDTNGSDDITNATAAQGDVSGQFPTLAVDRIKGRAVSGNTPANGQVLKWNATAQAWEPQDDEKGGGGTTGDNWGSQVVQTTGTALSGIGTASSPLTLASQNAATGQVLKWNGSNWIPQNDQTGSGGGQTTVTVTQNGLSISGDPTIGYTITNTGDTNSNDDLTTNSQAGGDLNGPLSNLQLNPGAVGTTEISNGSISSDDLSQMGASNGQVLKWNGSTWVPQNDLDNDAQTLTFSGGLLTISGSNSSVNLPTGATYLEGQGIDISPSNVISVDNTVLTNSSQAGGDVTGTFGNLQIGANTIGSNEIINGSIKKEDLDPTLTLGGGGQWSQNGTKLYYNNGNVGVGINDPLAPLHIVATGTTATGVVASFNQANGTDGSGGTPGETNIGVLGTYNTDAYGSGVAGIGYDGVLPPFANTDIGVYGSATNGIFGVGITGVTGQGTAVTGIAGTNARAAYFQGEVQNNGVFSILQPSANTLQRKVIIGANPTGEGYISLLDGNNNRNVLLSGFQNSPNTGAVSVFGPSASQTYPSGVLYSDALGRGQIALNSDSGVKVGGGVTSSGDGVWVVNGPNGNPNVFLGSDPANLNHGLAGVATSTGSVRAGMNILSSGQGYLFADVVSAGVKNFRIVHPNDPTKEIWYACVEGPEAAAYERGTATMVNGVATVRFTEHFEAVANYKTMTVILTPLSAESKGMAVVEKTRTGFVVRELLGGTGTYQFDWEVKGVRKGYENYQAVRPREPYPADYRLPVLQSVNISTPDMPSDKPVGVGQSTPKQKR